MQCPLRRLLDYEDPNLDLQEGQAVIVPLGRRYVFGLVVSVGKDSQHHELKPVSESVPGLILDQKAMVLLRWVWQYYHEAPGEICMTALPALIRRSSPYKPQPVIAYQLTEHACQLSADTFKRAPRQKALWMALSARNLTPAELDRQVDNWRPAMRVLQAKALIEEFTLDGDSSIFPSLPGWQLNPEQASAFERLCGQSNQHQAWLLDGVTGSGKTAVYVHWVYQLVQQGRQVLVLVPEIGLVPQLVSQIAAQLDIQPLTYHSGLSDRERANTWWQFSQGDTPIVVGTRSAVFIPAKNLGGIIVDEEHDVGYKQFEGVHYHARDVAIKRAALHQVSVVLGSATPSLETLANVKRGKYEHLKLRHRHVQGGEPEWRILDCRLQQFQEHHQQNPVTRVLHPAVVSQIRETTGAGHQVLIFLNRRGYARLLQCNSCGWQARCQQCGKMALTDDGQSVLSEQLLNKPMTWHRGQNRLICHHCGYQAAPPRVCPDCASTDLLHAGPGTEKLEYALRSEFADMPVHRVDSDSMSAKGKLAAMRAEVLQQEACILVGTQMLSKGHHFPRIALVIAVDIDAALFSTDYRATERLLQQLIQVAGRAGRGGQPATMILQTRLPEHPLLQQVIQHPYAVVAEFLLKQRQLAEMPPYAYQIVLRADSPQREQVIQFLQQARQNAPNNNDIQLHGPIPALLERRAGRYRYQLWITGSKRTILQAFTRQWVYQIEQLKGTRHLRWRIDVDPLEM